MRKLSKKLSNYRSGGASPSDNYGPQTPPVDRTSNPGPGSYHGGNTPDIKTKRTLQPTDRESATLEAELGETVVTNLNHEGIPEFYRIAGKRHSRGGTPLNLPSNSFIYSRDNKMKIKDPNILKFFGKNPKGTKGYTPADLSKQYDLNKYREILADPNSDKMQRDTAQLMIQNYNMKLGSLALAQESLKGFDRGLPAIATPVLQRFGVNPKSLIDGVNPEDNDQQDQRVAQIDMSQKKTDENMPKAIFGRETQLESKMVTKNQNNVWNQMWNNPDAKLAATQGVTNLLNSNQGPNMDEVLSADNVFSAGIPPQGGDFSFNQSLGYVGENTPVQNTGNIYSQGTQSFNFTKYGGQKFRFGGNYKMHGGEPHDFSDFEDTSTIPGMSPEVLAYQRNLANAEAVAGPVDFTYKNVNAPGARDGYTMIHGVDNGVAENQYWVPDAQATGVIDHSKLKGNYPLVTNSDGTPYTLSQGAGYGDVTEMDNSTNVNPMDEFRMTPPPAKLWSGGEAGAEPVLAPGENISGNNIFNADGDIVGYKEGDSWKQYSPSAKYDNEATDEKTVETSSKATNIETIPEDTDAEFFDPNSDGFDESQIEEGDYILKGDKWHKVTQIKSDPYKGQEIDTLPDKLKGDSGDLREDYGRLKYMIESNDDVKKEIISRYRAKMNEAKAGRFMSTADIAVAKNLDDDQVIQNFLESQLQVMAINANKGMIRGSEGEADWDKTIITDNSSPYYGLPKSYVQTAQDLDFTPKSKGETYGFQTAYIELEKMARDPKYKDILKDFTLTGDTQWGTADETVDGVSNRTVSPADGWWGNTTTGQAALYNPEGKDWKYEEVGLPEDSSVDTEGLEGTTVDNTPYGWTAPDVMQLGFDVRNRLGLKKYRPWAGKDIPTYMTPRFTSMEQPISRVNAQVMGALEGAGRMGANPQAFAANASALGKTSANSIIDAGFKEQLSNIQSGAKADMFNTQIANQSNRLNNGLAKSLYDGNTIMNQTFDNSKRAMGQRFVSDYATGWRNASTLQNLNKRDPNYNIDPFTGKQYGTFKEGDLAATYNPGQDLSTATTNLLETVPGLTPDKAADLAYKMLNPRSTGNNMSTRLNVRSQPATMDQIEALRQQLNNK